MERDWLDQVVRLWSDVDALHVVLVVEKLCAMVHKLSLKAVTVCLKIGALVNGIDVESSYGANQERADFQIHVHQVQVLFGPESGRPVVRFKELHRLSFTVRIFEDGTSQGNIVVPSSPFHAESACCKIAVDDLLVRHRTAPHLRSRRFVFEG